MSLLSWVELFFKTSAAYGLCLIIYRGWLGGNNTEQELLLSLKCASDSICGVQWVFWGEKSNIGCDQALNKALATGKDKNRIAHQGTVQECQQAEYEGKVF